MTGPLKPFCKSLKKEKFSGIKDIDEAVSRLKIELRVNKISSKREYARPQFHLLNLLGKSRKKFEVFHFDAYDKDKKEVRVNFFDESCTKWFGKIEVNKVYSLQRFRLRHRQLTSNNPNSDHEIDVTPDSKIEEIFPVNLDIFRIPPSLAKRFTNEIIDIIGWMKFAWDPYKSGKPEEPIVTKTEIVPKNTTDNEKMYQLWNASRIILNMQFYTMCVILKVIYIAVNYILRNCVVSSEGNVVKIEKLKVGSGNKILLPNDQSFFNAFKSFITKQKFGFFRKLALQSMYFNIL